LNVLLGWWILHPHARDVGHAASSLQEIEQRHGKRDDGDQESGSGEQLAFARIGCGYHRFVSAIEEFFVAIVVGHPSRPGALGWGHVVQGKGHR
jgi:hypothetical protein